MAIFKKKGKSRASQVPSDGVQQGEFVSPSSSLAKESISSINSVTKTSIEGGRPLTVGGASSFGTGSMGPSSKPPGALPGLNSPFKPGSSMGFSPGAPQPSFGPVSSHNAYGRESASGQYAQTSPTDMRSPGSQVQAQSSPLQQQQQQQQQHRSMQSPFPWTRMSLQRDCPFPRYGHASNPTAARDGEVFVMGGLKGSNVFGDLWVIESDSLTCYQLNTEGCPSPRVGHAALTLGNAFIVFGGDTKIEEHDELDDNLYLLNTTTLKWTVASSSGPRPSGRYGHTIATVGSKVFVFGGQLDDYFFDDLLCYDLTMLRKPEAQWELVVTKDGVRPPPRTNHSMVMFQDKLYLFGGTDGKLWYSDTWCYDPVSKTWSQLDCTGYLPAPCEGHSATIVGDIMYVFGGRSSQGKDLGTLSALKLSMRKWYTFQNLGPGPSPRSGHSMTAYGTNKILVMGGESPGEHGGEENKNNTVFVLDTTRINYPPAPEGTPRNVSAPYDTSMRDESSSRLSAMSSGPAPAIPPARGSLDGGAVSSPPLQSARYLPMTAHTEEDEKSSSATFESADETRSKQDRDHTPETLNSRASHRPGETRVPGGWQQPINVDDSDSLYDDVTLRQMDSPKGGPQVVAATEGRSDEDQVKSMAEAIERLKASNSWYESQLATAKENGYLAKDAPLDILKMRRVSQIVTQDNNKSLAERDYLLAALGELKTEFENAQTALSQRAREASERITAVERMRDELAEENKQLQEQLNSGNNAGPKDLPVEVAELQKQLLEERNSKYVLVQQLEKLEQLDHYRSQNVILEQELRRYTDKQVVLEHEVSQLKAKLSTAQEKVKSLSESAEHQVTALAASGAAVVSAESRVADLSKQLENYKTKCSELNTHVEVLGRQVNDYASNEKRLREEMNEHKTLLDHATSEAEQASKSMSEGISQIVALWENLSPKGNTNNISDEEDEDPRLLEMQAKMQTLSEQMNRHKEGGEKTSNELKIAIEELQELRRELVNSEEARREMELKIATSQHELQSSNETYQSKLSEHDRTLEEHASLQQVCKQLEEKCNELEHENEQSMQILRNTDKALSKTKEEVAKYRELSSKLEEEINELRLTHHDGDTDGKEDGDSLNSRSGSAAGVSSNRHFDLQLRDLRTQVIILQQERDELRSSLVDYKKKAITNSQDYDEAKDEIERLARENSKLEQRLTTLLTSTTVDPVSGQSLDDFADELNKINEGRERRSGILRNGAS